MNVALVEHAQDHIHGQQRRQDQDRLVGQRLLERLRGTLEGTAQGRRRAELARACSMALVTWPSATPGGRLNDRVDRRQLALMRNAEAVGPCGSTRTNSDSGTGLPVSGDFR